MRVWPLAVLLFAAPASTDSLDARCGPGGYGRPGGCELDLGRRDVPVPATIEVGNCTTLTSRPALTLFGHGAAMTTAVGSNVNLAGTTLVWNGPQGGTMLRICGAQKPVLRDFAMRMNSAALAIHLRGDNMAGTPINGAALERLWIDGNGTVGQRGILIDGPRQNDQVDQVAIRDVHIGRVSTCIEQDSQQATINSAEHLNCSSSESGLHIRSGDFTIRTSYFGQIGSSSTYAAVRGTSKSDPPDGYFRSPGRIVIQDSHYETHVGAGIKIDGGWHALLVEGSNFLALDADKAVRWLETSDHHGGVSMIGNTWRRNGSSQARDSIKLAEGDVAVFLANVDVTARTLLHGSAPALCVGGHSCAPVPELTPVSCKNPDVDGSGSVTMGDMALFLACYTGASSDPRCDVDGSGDITAADFACLRAAF